MFNKMRNAISGIMIYSFVSFNKTEARPRYKLSVKASSLDIAYEIARKLMIKSVFQQSKPN